MQLLLSLDSPLRVPADFIRVPSSGISLQETFKQEIISYLGGEDVIVNVFSIQVTHSLFSTFLLPSLGSSDSFLDWHER